MALTSDIRGVVPIAPTPFHEDGRIDEHSLDRLTDFYAGAEVDGLTILGQLGHIAAVPREVKVGEQTMCGWHPFREST